MTSLPDLGRDFLTRRTSGDNLANNLPELNQVGKSRGIGRPVAQRPVGKLSDSMQNADGEGFFAGRADPGMVVAARRIEADAALAMSV